MPPSFIQDLVEGGIKHAKGTIFDQAEKLSEKLKAKTGIDLDWLADEAGAGLIRGDGSDSLVEIIATVAELGIDGATAYVAATVAAASGGTAGTAATAGLAYVASLAHSAKDSIVAMIKGDTVEDNNFEKGEWVIIHSGREERRRMPNIVGSEEEIRDKAGASDAVIQAHDHANVGFTTERSNNGQVMVKDVQNGEFSYVNVKTVQKLAPDIQNRLDGDEVLSGVKDQFMQKRSNSHKRLDGPNTAPGSKAFMEDGRQVVMVHVDDKGRCTVTIEGGEDKGKKLYVDYNTLTAKWSESSNNPVPGRTDNGFMQSLGFSKGQWVWARQKDSLYQLAVVSGISPLGIAIYYPLTAGMETVPPAQCERVNEAAFQYTEEQVFAEFQLAATENDYKAMSEISKIIQEEFTEVTEVNRKLRSEWFYIVPREYIEKVTWGGALQGEKVINDPTGERARMQTQLEEYDKRFGRSVDFREKRRPPVAGDDKYLREFGQPEKEKESSNVTVYVLVGVAAVAVLYFATK